MRLDIGQIRHPEEMVSPERLLDGLWESGFDEASIIGLQRPVSRGDLEQIRDQREHLFDMIERDFLEFLRLILGEVVNIHDTDDYVELLSSPTDMTALETNTRVILSLLLSADLFIDNDAPRLVEAFVSGYQSELRQHSGYPSLSIATS